MRRALSLSLSLVRMEKNEVHGVDVYGVDASLEGCLAAPLAHNPVRHVFILHYHQ